MTKASLPPRVCFVGAGRFSAPLDATQAKKFELLSRIADVQVIAFAARASAVSFSEHARFHLFRMPKRRLWRYVALTTTGTARLAALVCRRQVDIVIAQSPYEAIGPVVVKQIAKLLGHRIRCIVESHGDFEVAVFDYRRVRFARLHKFLMGACARYTLRRADAVRAVSRSTAEQIERVARRHDVHVFHTWTDLESFLAGPPVEKDAGALVYAGTLVPAKGLHVLVEAVARIARRGQTVRLRIIGRAENEEYAAELRRLVDSLDLRDVVEFHDPMPQAQLAGVMRRAQALVLPSISSEGLPRVFLEAMATRTALVATSIAGAVDVIREGENGLLVPPGDVDVLTDRLSQILTSPVRAKAMGDRGRAFVEGRFGADVYQRGYARLLEDVLRPDLARAGDAQAAARMS